MPRDSSIDYYTYIQSYEWRVKATAAKQRAGFRCQVCNRPSSQVQLDAHHRTYERLGNELPSDITVLCRGCHELYERNGKLPRPPTRKLEVQPSAVSAPIAPQPAPVKRSANPAPYIWISLLVLVGVYFYWQNRANALDNDYSTPGPAQGVKPTQQATAALPPTPAITWYPAESTKNSNVRAGPSTSYPVLTTVPSGARILVFGYSNENGWPWYCIRELRYQLFGWISSELVRGAPDRLPLLSECGTNPQVSPRPQPTAKPTVPPPSQQRTPTQVAGCPGGCTTYPTWCPGAPIKGNVSYDSGEKIYHVVGQAYYDETVISPAYGERWFCTEAEALAAGWRKAYK